ncbi:DUF1566 domain-containing protein [Trinickia acidisoli]|uniref:DUF1566 domain-containing protein n=1 Tax=Trinickia acidisoli TaxID=2767482 RepID=UPI001A8CBFE9|nr:DUF1566 domain-containing protein [Trinickia acidisoli]
MIDTTQGVRLADAPKLGEYWPGQGGLYAGIMPDYEGTQPRVLIVAEDEAVDIPWGGFGATEEGAHEDGDGHANTRDLVGCPKPWHGHHAARFAAAYEKDGHKDFYLPSHRELEIANVTIRDAFDKTDWYWSSTEQSSAMAWGRSFGDVHLESLFKHMPARARPVRSMLIIDGSATSDDE